VTDATVPSGATAADEPVLVAVVGAHLTGMPLNHQLTDRGATLVRSTRTATAYRLYDLGGSPARPGLVRTVADGVADPGAGAIEVEVWSLGTGGFGSFVTLVPSPLCIGTVELEDGSTVAGFLCEEIATRGATDVTATGGWRAHLRSSPPT
jgi:allophanate hydrolase